jgi:hypothetical protein
LSTAATVAAGPFVAGRDYEVLTGAPARLGAAARAVESIEGVEFFMFECFPCYALEADLNRWEAEQGSSVSLYSRSRDVQSRRAATSARVLHSRRLGKLDAIARRFLRRDPLARETHWTRASSWPTSSGASASIVRRST